MLLVKEKFVFPMPDDLKENDKFPEPIITPTTKADNGKLMPIFQEKKF
jgi:phosphoribosylaminoimidazole-succinocarboxamide synthase